MQIMTTDGKIRNSEDFKEYYVDYESDRKVWAVYAYTGILKLYCLGRYKRRQDADNALIKLFEAFERKDPTFRMPT